VRKAGFKASVGEIPELHLRLPQTREFQALSISGDATRAMKATESGK